MMMSMKLALVIYLTVCAAVEGRPQHAVAVIKSLGIGDALGQVLKPGSSDENLLNSVKSTTQTIREGIIDLFSDMLKSTQKMLFGINTAVRDTAVGKLQGVRDAAGAATDFVQDTARAGGRLAIGAADTSFNVTRDVIGASGQFVTGVSSSATQGLNSVADVTGEFAEETVDVAGRFANAANEVARRVVVSGIENFTNP